MSGKTPRILVIRLGALGDFIESFQAFQAIRSAHPSACITLLTTPPFKEIAQRCPWFDTVLLEERAPWYKLGAHWDLYKSIKKLEPIDRVYDLQTSDRTGWYSFFIKTASWNGHKRSGYGRVVNPYRDILHTRTRQCAELRDVGISTDKTISYYWLLAQDYAVPEQPYIVLVPGASPKRLYKSWPVFRYQKLAKIISEKGYLPVIVGSANERSLARTIAGNSGALDLTGKTTLPQLARVFYGARCAIGNDTGPMHLAASVGQRCIVLFSKYSVPAQDAPLGYCSSQVEIFWMESLAELTAQEVAHTLFPRLIL